MVPLDEVVHFDAITSDPTTGAAADATGTPTFSVFEEATDTPILSAQEFTKRTDLTGNYRGTFTASAENGFEVGKWYNVIASATVSGVAGKAVVMRFRIAAAESVAGLPKVDTDAIDGTADKATQLAAAIGTATVATTDSSGVTELLTRVADTTYAVAISTGNWGTNGTWLANTPPSAGDHIIIQHNVEVTIAATLDLGQFGSLTLLGNGHIDIAADKTVATVPTGWTIATNNGDVTYNYGTVKTNSASGTISENYGTVSINQGEVTTNNNKIWRNIGDVGNNYGGGVVDINTGTGEITDNYGTVTYNYGSIAESYGTVEINYSGGNVAENTGGVVLYNGGTVTLDGGIVIYGTSSQAALKGDEMDLVDAPNVTAIVAIQSEGLPAGILYVSKQGDDGNDGRSWASALETIGAAIAAASSGDTIYIGAGTYTEALTIDAKSISLIGTGRPTITQAVADTPTLLATGATSLTLKGLRIVHSLATMVSGTCVVISANSDGYKDVFIDDCVFEGNGGIALTGFRTISVTNCVSRGSEYGIVVEAEEILVDSVQVINSAWTECNANGIVLSPKKAAVVRNCNVNADGSVNYLADQFFTHGIAVFPCVGEETVSVLVENCSVRSLATGTYGIAAAITISSDEDNTGNLIANVVNCCLSSEASGANGTALDIWTVDQEHIIDNPEDHYPLMAGGTAECKVFSTQYDTAKTAGNVTDEIEAIPTATRDVDNTTPAAGSLGEAVNTAAAGGGALSAQETRDAMLLAPTGVPAVGSIDKHLDDLLVDAATIAGDVAALTGVTGNVTIASPVDLVTGTLYLVKGDDYTTGTDNLVTFTDNDSWPDLATATTITLYFRKKKNNNLYFSVTGTHIPGDPQQVSFEIPASLSIKLDADASDGSSYVKYYMVATFGTEDRTIGMGTVYVEWPGRH